jgi:hypothetical protein
MVFNNVKHLIKMANHIQSNLTWSIILCIYPLPTHPHIYLVNYLPTYYPHVCMSITYLPTYLPIPSHLPTYLPTHPPSEYLPTCPPIYLLKFSYQV